MARKFTTKVSEGFLDMVETKGVKGYGAIHITQKDRKNWAKIFIRYGTVYAIEASTYKINVLNRITMLDSINDRSRNLLRQRFGSDPEDIRAVEAALGQQMAPENELNRITREFFMDSFYEVYQWENTTMTWSQNEEPKISQITGIKPTELIEKVDNIKDKLEHNVAPAIGVELNEIDSLKPSKGSITPEGEMRNDEIILISYSEGNSSLREISYATGRSLSMTKFMTKRLWEQNFINLTTPEGKLLVYSEPAEIIPAPIEPEPNLEEEETLTPPPASQSNLFDNDDDEEDYTSVEDFFQNLRAPQPVAVKEEITAPKVFTPEVEQPKTLPTETPNDNEEFDIDSVVIEELPNLESFTEISVLPELEAPAPYETTEEEEPLMENSTPSNSKVGSRVTKMVNELKTMLREYKETIQKERQELSELHNEVTQLHEKREQYLKNIDTEIAEKSSLYASLAAAAEENSNDYTLALAQLKVLQGND